MKNLNKVIEVFMTKSKSFCTRALLLSALAIAPGCLFDKQSTHATNSHATNSHATNSHATILSDQTDEVSAKQICEAVKEYMSQNAGHDPLLDSQMQEVKLENMHVSSDGVIWFGSEWRYEAQPKRLFKNGGKIGDEITWFVINFGRKNERLVVRDAKTLRFYGTVRKP